MQVVEDVAGGAGRSQTPTFTLQLQGAGEGAQRCLPAWEPGSQQTAAPVPGHPAHPHRKSHGHSEARPTEDGCGGGTAKAPLFQEAFLDPPISHSHRHWRLGSGPRAVLGRHLPHHISTQDPAQERRDLTRVRSQQTAHCQDWTSVSSTQTRCPCGGHSGEAPLAPRDCRHDSTHVAVAVPEQEELERKGGKHWWETLFGRAAQPPALAEGREAGRAGRGPGEAATAEAHPVQRPGPQNFLRWGGDPYL